MKQILTNSKKITTELEKEGSKADHDHSQCLDGSMLEKMASTMTSKKVGIFFKFLLVKMPKWRKFTPNTSGEFDLLQIKEFDQSQIIFEESWL